MKKYIFIIGLLIPLLGYSQMIDLSLDTVTGGGGGGISQIDNTTEVVNLGDAGNNNDSIVFIHNQRFVVGDSASIRAVEAKLYSSNLTKRTTAEGIPTQDTITGEINGRMDIIYLDFGYNICAFAAGTAYTLTASNAAIDFTGGGSVDPSITINKAGTYLVLAESNMQTIGATYAVTDYAHQYVYRTNNTPADITPAEINKLTIPVMTTDTTNVGTWQKSFIYSTSNTNDILSLYGKVENVPDNSPTGSVQVKSASICAIKLK